MRYERPEEQIPKSHILKMPHNPYKLNACSIEFPRISISAHISFRPAGRQIRIQMQEASAAIPLSASILPVLHIIQAEIQTSLQIRSHRKKIISILYEM